MKCARLHLQERSKVKIKPEPPALLDKPRRYCQKRLVNPEHEEDPRWMDVWDRFHCNLSVGQTRDTADNEQCQQETEDMVLTVQTLKFQGDVDQTKRPRNSFKFKTVTDGNKHRMFVKQVVTDNDYCDEDRFSQLTYYYFDDYVKYLCSSDRSRPTSGKSSIFFKSFTNNVKENKPTHIERTQTEVTKKVRNLEITQTEETKKVRKAEPKLKSTANQCPKPELKEEIKKVSETIENAKITYQKSGKRKSLTISRTQSPETVQVIRVDVVCNYPSSSVLSDYEETKKGEHSPVRALSRLESVKKNHFASKYLLTNSIKTLDESLCDGSKVTLLCKTFKLSDRLLEPSDNCNVGKNRKHVRSFKYITKSDNKSKSRK